MKALLIISVMIVLLGLTACEQNRYSKADALYQQHRYAAAIELLDNYIQTGNNGALITRAELVRSNCYYELGMAAIEKENWPLAIRLLKLANSEQSDVELAKVYRNLALDALEAQDIPKAMSYFTLIIDEIPQSDLVPEILYMRIKTEIENMGDRLSAWNDYVTLYDRFPENQYELLARPYIQRFITLFIDAAVAKAVNNEFDQALEDLFKIRRYPVGDQNRIELEISNIYQEEAEIQVQAQDYFEANRLFLKVIQYYPAKKPVIDKRLRDIAYLYIEKGNSYLDAKEFDNAMLYYQKTFEIIPDFDLAKQAIAKLNTIRNNIKLAVELAEEALKLETSKNYAEAQKTYQHAYQLDKLPAYYERSQIMSNMIEADKNPVSFARNIILDYKNGILYKRIQAQKQELLKRYNKDEIRDSGWNILMSSGQYKYEARYDLVTPAENLYFVWQINLRDRTIIPLNKLSEKLMQ
jgi:tetratricopeptide (TPR) repeat protein